MTAEELLAQNVALCVEADPMMDATGLLGIMSGYGRPHPSGSYEQATAA